ncbi:PucR family transcriptional regulator [Paenibacillus pini]|nr:helix-turn-helix domain-containing protein [Paenibacillus pini]
METLRSKLELIIGSSIRMKELSKPQSELMYSAERLLQDFLNIDEFTWFPLYVKNGVLHVFEVKSDCISSEVMQLIAMLVRQQREEPLSAHGEEERGILRLSQWIQAQLELEQGEAELPDDLEFKRRLGVDMVPFLLICESIHITEVSSTALKRLLRSYFDGDVILIPLREQEWLVLARKELVAGGNDEKDDDGVESETDMLSAFGLGLYELIASEWVGTFHLALAPVFSPVKSLPSMVGMLRETIFLGRTFHVTEHVHFPWELLLERLIYSIPPVQRRRFLDQAGDHGVLFTDSETLATLETFFQLDCNVSETAKRLYIHRNTLLYRLDKIKQETGLDVRSFGDAVLVKLTMLLYKVTKRK